MKKIIIISDNLLLIEFFKNLEIKKELNKIANFVYCFSSANKNPDPLIATGVMPINVKNINTCERIVKEFDLVISLHCKQIFPDFLVENIRCINIHPGLNPHNRGWYPQVFSIINKKPAGATIHLMNKEIDAGPIIAQKEVEVSPGDSSRDVYDKIINAEKNLLSDNIVSIINETYQITESFDEGNYNSISDFRKLCELDLNHKGRLIDHIDLLRALTHGDFKNAYFDINGERYFIKIEITKA